MFFKKKDVRPIEFVLNKELWYRSERYYSSEISYKQPFISDGMRNYTFLIRDGAFGGQPHSVGGRFFPFSPNPEVMGTKAEAKQYSFAEVVAIKKDFVMKVEWGTPPHRLYYIEDPLTKVPYRVGANGVFMVTLDPTDAARNANQFFLQLLSASPDYNIEDLKQFLQDEYLQKIGAMIETVIQNEKRSLANYIGLGPKDLARVGDLLFADVEHIFSKYGLTVTTNTLNALTVTPVNV